MLPATYHELIEAQALAHARQRMARMLEGDFLELGCPPLHPDGGRRLVHRLIQQYALTDAPSMLAITQLAECWDEADQALRDLILEYTNRGAPLPAFLATFNARILKGYSPGHARARKKVTNFLQDFALVYLIVELRVLFGLNPTRYQAGKKRRASCCSIIAQAAAEAGLHRGAEGALQKLWERFEPIVTRIDMEQIIRN
jgi:hypothetical protein